MKPEFEAECKEYYEFMVRARAAAAQRITEERRLFRDTLSKCHMTPEARGKLWRDWNSLLRRNNHAPIKPSRKHLRRAAVECLSYSRTTWVNPYDTEYYSA